jgi:hypothetical protein
MKVSFKVVDARIDACCGNSKLVFLSGFQPLVSSFDTSPPRRTSFDNAKPAL